MTTDEIRIARENLARARREYAASLEEVTRLEAELATARFRAERDRLEMVDSVVTVERLEREQG